MDAKTMVRSFSSLVLLFGLAMARPRVRWPRITPAKCRWKSRPPCLSVR